MTCMSALPPCLSGCLHSCIGCLPICLLAYLCACNVCLFACLSFCIVSNLSAIDLVSPCAYISTQSLPTILPFTCPSPNLNCNYMDNGISYHSAFCTMTGLPPTYGSSPTPLTITSSWPAMMAVKESDESRKGPSQALDTRRRLGLSAAALACPLLLFRIICN